MFEKVNRHTDQPEWLVNQKERSTNGSTNRKRLSPRISMLREESLSVPVTLSIERALLVTAFYREYAGKYSAPVMRAMNFMEICKSKDIYIGPGELIVGERGEKPRAVYTFPELTCHSVNDLQTLRTREQQNYQISDEDINQYAQEVIPFWRGRTQRDQILAHVSEEWESAYNAGLFTEFMEQRAPGHTCLDGKIYRKGMLDFKQDIQSEISKLDYIRDPEASEKYEELKGMDISCDAIILLAERHAIKAEELSAIEPDQNRKTELLKIAEVCRWVPAHAPRTFWEAIQMYWFVHLGTIIELNGWDAMNPGHFDQHLISFYEKEITAGTLNYEEAKELLSCFWIKVNNQPAPPKVGITARESGTYNDFTNINIGGVKPDGSDGVNEISYMMLEIIQDLHILQPGNSVHISAVTQDDFIQEAIKVIRLGYGYPSVFNADAYLQEMLRSGKSLKDAREGGCSGCIEVGAFGKEAYILTGYLNVPKVLEITLFNGIDPLSGKRVGRETGDPATFTDFEQLYQAFRSQLNYIINLKIKANSDISRMFAQNFPATFLSVLIDDCIKKGKDYNNGGARYNTTYIQCTGLGTVSDSLSSLKKHVFGQKSFTIDQLKKTMINNYAGEEVLRQMIMNNTPFFGNDDNFVDDLAVRVFNDLFELIDGRPNGKEGGKYHLNMLSTTCHIYFGKMLGASPNGRLSGKSISDGTSPSHGCDLNGPSAVINSLSKIEHFKSGGTLLNLRFLPGLLKRDEDINKLGSLIRYYFAKGGHHVQFNIVDTATLLEARLHPEEYKDLLVRMAGYSDYFNDMNDDLKQEVIERTENDSF